MKICIKLNETEEEYELYGFQYWNQRFFCLGVSLNDGSKEHFISTKGFDKLLIKSYRGAAFRFKLGNFSPYLCNKEKSMFKESDKINTEEEDFLCNDTGPSEWSGEYIKCASFDQYIDNVYFETKPFELDKFDLFKYRTDPEYYHMNKTQKHDSLPMVYDGRFVEVDSKTIHVIRNAKIDKVFNNTTIIHGVCDNGKEYVDKLSLVEMCNLELNYIDKKETALHIICRAIEPGFLHTISFGLNDFYILNELERLEGDCGNAFIKKNYRRYWRKKKQVVFRGLYEYFNNIKHITSKLRKTKKIGGGAKDTKAFDFIVVFKENNVQSFKIVYFEDISSANRSADFNPYFYGSEFSIDCSINYKTGTVEFDKFSSKAELFKFIEDKFDFSKRMALSRLLKLWFGKISKNGFAQVSTLPMADKANCRYGKYDRNCIKVISVPHFEYDGSCIYMPAFLDTYEFLAVFGIHILKVRCMLEDDKFCSSFFDEIRFDIQLLEWYSDPRKSLIQVEDYDTIEISKTMINMNHAFRLLRLFGTVTKYNKNGKEEGRNSFWYRNANKLIQSFPDAFERGVCDNYKQLPSLREYVEMLEENDQHEV